MLERRPIYALTELTTIQRTTLLQNQVTLRQQLPLSLQLQFSSQGHLKSLPSHRRSLADL